MIKRSAIAGGVVWAAPTLLASPAGAGETTCSCAAGHLFGLRTEQACNCTSIPNNQTACLPADPSGCCLITAGLISVACSNPNPSGINQTHTYTLAAGVQFCNWGAKGGGGPACGGSGTAGGGTLGGTIPVGGSGPGTVVITHTTMSHSEITVCVPGTIPDACVD